MKWPFAVREHVHNWFPGLGEREFIVTHDVCLKCGAERVLRPWGECLTGHPIQEHYDDHGDLQPVPDCPGPQ